ncbi:MAG: phosphoglucosamine mutase [Eubacteriales bacterium]|jgi:phosphoglucosamine mutase|nr:phosphoglucosamine mutase [Eubacteriales bacterium]
MGKLFGTDGVRGIANSELTAELAFKLGQAGAYILAQQANHRAKILIGKDTRISSDMLEAAIAAGICSVGAEAVLIGVVPTPAIAYLTKLTQADAGVVISASHNSMEYNGIKFFNNKGYKLGDDIEEKIEDIILSDTKLPLPTGEGLGSITYDFEAKKKYMQFAKSTAYQDFTGLKIAIDCANGASYAIASKVLEELGAEIFTINDSPNGININDKCGSTHMEGLKKFVKEKGADIGLAFDGDADRVLAVDENGDIVDGDKILAICGSSMLAKGKLENNTIVATVMSNLGLYIAAKKLGINILQADVGDRHVLEEMLKGGHKLGGEQSGHIIFLDHSTTGDGLITGIQLVCALKESGKKLSELAKIMTVMPQVLVNAKVKNENKYTYLSYGDIKAEIEKIEEIFHGRGRVLIRPSGTEPLVRVMIEGEDIDFITKKARHLADLIEQKLA